MKDVLTLDEVTSYLRVHRSTIYRLLRKKQLPAFKVARDWRFCREALDEWIAKRTTAQMANDEVRDIE